MSFYLEDRQRLLHVAALGVVLMAGPVRASVATPVSGAMRLQATAIIDPVVSFQLSTDAWAVIPSDLAVIASATAVKGDYFAHVSGSAAANWLSPDQGRVTFKGYRWDFSITDPGQVGGVFLCDPGCGAPPDWTYTFTANAGGGFRMTYDVVGQGVPSLQGWQGFWSGGGCCDVAAIGADGVHLTGIFAHPIVAGQTYTFSLSNFANIWGGIGVGAASMDGVFNWTISTQGVPEPATWAGMLVGLGGVGTIMRIARRKHQALLTAA